LFCTYQTEESENKQANKHRVRAEINTVTKRKRNKVKEKNIET
jgi:hypothetical protein